MIVVMIKKYDRQTGDRPNTPTAVLGSDSKHLLLHKGCENLRALDCGWDENTLI